MIQKHKQEEGILYASITIGVKVDLYTKYFFVLSKILGNLQNIVLTKEILRTPFSTLKSPFLKRKEVPFLIRFLDKRYLFLIFC